MMIPRGYLAAAGGQAKERRQLDRQDRAQVLARTALALMGERGVSPTPQNYQLFYAFASGENPAVSQSMSERIAARDTFTPEVLDELRDRFFGAERLEEDVQNIGAEFAESVNAMLAKLADAEKDTVAYGRTLTAASGELHGDQTPANVERLVKSLLGATRAMETRAKNLESELQRSSLEVNDLRTKLDDVRKEALTDPLTGIANRKALDLELLRAVEHARTRCEPLSLFMCDIDHFKVFNDSWGHQTGDQVLRLVASCLSENVKGRDTAARYGGEEFAVILRQTPLASAITLADQIRAHVQGKKLVKRSTGDILGTLTISIGVAQLAVGDGPADLIRRADACLYAAKNSGRNRVVGEDDAALPGSRGAAA
jgi:diguanylate cyclase